MEKVRQRSWDCALCYTEVSSGPGNEPGITDYHSGLPVRWPKLRKEVCHRHVKCLSPQPGFCRPSKITSTAVDRTLLPILSFLPCNNVSGKDLTLPLLFPGESPAAGFITTPLWILEKLQTKMTEQLQAPFSTVSPSLCHRKPQVSTLLFLFFQDMWKAKDIAKYGAVKQRNNQLVFKPVPGLA